MHLQGPKVSRLLINKWLHYMKDEGRNALTVAPKSCIYPLLVGRTSGYQCRCSGPWLRRLRPHGKLVPRYVVIPSTVFLFPVDHLQGSAMYPWAGSPRPWVVLYSSLLLVTVALSRCFNAVSIFIFQSCLAVSIFILVFLFF